jgi:hypothetical protein
MTYLASKLEMERRALAPKYPFLKHKFNPKVERIHCQPRQPLLVECGPDGEPLWETAQRLEPDQVRALFRQTVLQKIARLFGLD